MKEIAPLLFGYKKRNSDKTQKTLMPVVAKMYQTGSQKGRIEFGLILIQVCGAGGMYLLI